MLEAKFQRRERHGQRVPGGQESYIALNAELSKGWPVITVRGEPPADAADWDGKPGKLIELLR